MERNVIHNYVKSTRNLEVINNLEKHGTAIWLLMYCVKVNPVIILNFEYY